MAKTASVSQNIC